MTSAFLNLQKFYKIQRIYTVVVVRVSMPLFKCSLHPVLLCGGISAATIRLAIFHIFIIVNKSHEKTETNKVFVLLSILSSFLSLSVALSPKSFFKNGYKLYTFLS